MKPDLPVWRSMLFVPVTAQRFVDGAAKRGADAIILDLEDAVAASEKDRARTLVPEAAQSLHFDDVLFRPVETDPPLPVELYAAWRSDNENPALPPFLDLLRPAAEPEDLDALEDPAFEPD